MNCLFFATPSFAPNSSILNFRLPSPMFWLSCVSLLFWSYCCRCTLTDQSKRISAQVHVLRRTGRILSNGKDLAGRHSSPHVRSCSSLARGSTLSFCWSSSGGTLATGLAKRDTWPALWWMKVHSRYLKLLTYRNWSSFIVMSGVLFIRSYVCSVAYK